MKTGQILAQWHFERQEHSLYYKEHNKQTLLQMLSDLGRIWGICVQYVNHHLNFTEIIQ